MSQVTMPKMGEAMEEGTLVRWLKREGESVDENEAIAEVETEKATMEVTSFVAGTVNRLLIKEGDTVAVNTPIAVVLEDGESSDMVASAPQGNGEEAIAKAEEPPNASAEEPLKSSAAESDRSQAPSPSPRGSSPRESETRPAAPAAETRSAAEIAIDDDSDRVLASPLARKVAAESDVDLRLLQGTGPKGRIVEADVRDHLMRAPDAGTAPSPAASRPVPKAAPTSVAGEDRKVSRMRQVIARRLSESKLTIPHIYLTSEIDMSAAKAFLAQLKAVEIEGRPKPTLTDMIVKASALALAKRPELNSQFQGETIRFPESINVGVAVSLDEGLVVPVIRNCESKTLHQIAAVARPLFETARAGKLTPDDFAGGTFTISNLGMYDLESFVAIINPPQSAILAVGSILDQVVAYEGQVAIRPRMKVTLSADHRAVDGVLAAQFLQELKRLLQTPIALVE